jgi:hypothetical protein
MYPKVMDVNGKRRGHLDSFMASEIISQGTLDWNQITYQVVFQQQQNFYSRKPGFSTQKSVN